MNVKNNLFSILFMFFIDIVSNEVSKYPKRYTLISPSCPQVIIPHGFYRIKKTNTVKIVCYRGYQLFGSKVLICLGDKWNHEIPACVKSVGCGKLKTPDKGLLWPSLGGAVAGFMCYTGYIMVGSQTLICDGRNWNASEPRCIKPGSLNCNFDSENDPFCGWIQDVTDSWQVIPFEGGGSYLSVMGSNNARIISPLMVPITENKCFFFSRKLDPKTQLRIYLSTRKSTNLTISTSDNSWQNSSFILPSINDTYQVVIEALGEGNVSLDNFQMIDYDDCQLDVTSTTLKPSIQSNQTTVSDQSCRYRCASADALTAINDFDTTLPTETLKPDSPVYVRCDCHPGCRETSSCCQDFEHYCIARETYKPQIIKTTTASLDKITNNTTKLEPTTKTTTTSLPTTTKIASTSTTITTPTASSSTTIKLTTPKITTTKRPSTTTRSTPTTRRTTIPLTTTTKKFTTKKFIPITSTQSIRVTSTTSPERISTKITEKVTTLSTLLTTKTTATIPSTTPKMTLTSLTPVPLKENSNESSSWTNTIIFSVLGCGIFILFIVGVIWYVFRRRRIYIDRKLTNLAEDSDVRFLTGDEALDFTLQRPSPDDDDL